jgi:hypothetical protein
MYSLCVVCYCGLASGSANMSFANTPLRSINLITIKIYIPLYAYGRGLT